MLVIRGESIERPLCSSLCEGSVAQMLEREVGGEMIRDVLHVPPFLRKDTIKNNQFLQARLKDSQVHNSCALLADVCQSAFCTIDLVCQILKTLIFDPDIVVLVPGIFIVANCMYICYTAHVGVFAMILHAWPLEVIVFPNYRLQRRSVKASSDVENFEQLFISTESLLALERTQVFVMIKILSRNQEFIARALEPVVFERT